MNPFLDTSLFCYTLLVISILFLDHLAVAAKSQSIKLYGEFAGNHISSAKDSEYAFPDKSKNDLLSVLGQPLFKAKKSEKPPTLLLLVFSPPDAIHEREAIRQTWAHLAKSCNVKVVFPFAGKFKLKARRRIIEKERAKYSDVIEFPNVRDHHYRQQPLIENALRWALTNYPKTPYVGRATDDVWINFPKVMEHLKAQEIDSQFIMGHFVDETTKGAQEVIDHIYELPTPRNAFALAHLWILPTNLISWLLQSIPQRLKELDYINADMLFTGYMRRSRRIEAVNIEDYVNLWDLNDITGCKVNHITVIHGVYSDNKYGFFNQSCTANMQCLATHHQW